MVSDGPGETELMQRKAESSSTERLCSETVRATFETHRTELLAFLVGVLRDVNAAQDVSQITFCRLVEVGHTTREQTVKGWLFKVALREALVYRRQHSRHNRHLEQYAHERGDSLSIDSSGGSVDGLVTDETVTRLRQSLSAIPKEQQEVVRQRIYENKTFAEIACELNVPLGTVLTRMRLALQKVRKNLGTGLDDISRS